MSSAVYEITYTNFNVVNRTARRIYFYFKILIVRYIDLLPVYMILFHLLMVSSSSPNRFHLYNKKAQNILILALC